MTEHLMMLVAIAVNTAAVAAITGLLVLHCIERKSHKSDDEDDG